MYRGQMRRLIKNRGHQIEFLPAIYAWFWKRCSENAAKRVNNEIIV